MMTLEKAKQEYPPGTVVLNFFGHRAEVVNVEQDPDLVLRALEHSTFLTWACGAGVEYTYRPQDVIKVPS
jgi:hypothetical protein